MSQREDLFELVRRLQLEAEEHFFNLFLEARRGLGTGRWYPPADVFETEKAFVIRLEVPGTPLEDIKITLSGDRLTVSGIKKDEYQGGQRRFYQAEIVFGEFERTFSLPWSVKEEEVRAVYKDGILTIILHKPEPKRVKVDIQRE